MDLSQQTQTINQIHLNQLLSMSFWQNLPSSGESLEYCRSMRRRGSHWSSVVLPQEAELQSWAQQPSSSILAVSGQSRVVQKDFITEMAQLIRNHNLPVIWALRFPNHWDLQLTSFDILRILVLQALQMNHGSLMGRQASGKIESNPITLSHLREAASLDDWLKILEQALRNVPRIFILLDGDLLSQATRNDRQEAMILTELLRTKMAISATILVPASNLNRDHVDALRLQGDCVSLATDAHNRWGSQVRSAQGRKRRRATIKRQPVSNWMTKYTMKRQRQSR